MTLCVGEGARRGSVEGIEKGSGTGIKNIYSIKDLHSKSYVLSGISLLYD